MRPIRPANFVVFTDGTLEEQYLSLLEDNWLKKVLRKAIEDLKENVFAGENIPKRLIPKEYVKKYGIDNLWMYPLPNS